MIEMRSHLCSPGTGRVELIARVDVVEEDRYVASTGLSLCPEQNFLTVTSRPSIFQYQHHGDHGWMCNIGVGGAGVVGVFSHNSHGCCMRCYVICVSNRWVDVRRLERLLELVEWFVKSRP